MAIPIINTRRGRRRNDAQLNVKRVKGKYKPRGGAQRGRGLPTDPSPAVQDQMRSRRGADLAKSQIRSTGRATPETLGAALDRGGRRPAAERAGDSLSRRSTQTQQGLVRDSRGVPMTEAQRDQRGEYAAGKMRERLQNRRRARARKPDPAGSMSVQFAGQPERTLRGASAKLGGGIVTGQGVEDITGFKRDVRQDLLKQQMGQTGGMAPGLEQNTEQERIINQYEQVPQAVSSDVRAKFQVMDPLQNQSQAGLDARLGRLGRTQPQGIVPADQRIPNFEDAQRTSRAGFYPVQDAMVPQTPVAQPQVAPPNLAPAPMGMTPMEDTARMGAESQQTLADATVRGKDTEIDLARKAGGLPAAVAPGQVAPATTHSW